MTIITTNEDLAHFCARQAEADYLTLDTEFLRDSTYWPKLCLIQIGGPDDAAAIDTLAPNIDLEPVIALFDNPKILKVLHSGRQDMEIFFNLTGRLPNPVFDTQVAAMVCGFGESVGYDTLARRLTGARIDKTSRFTDWARRPLNNKQLSYALADVTYLRPIYESLKKSLDKSGRSSWLEEEMAVLTSTETYRLDPENAWRRLKTRSNDRRYLAVLQGLAAWREAEAQRRNVPRNRVLRDEQLFDIASHPPKTAEELAKSRGISGDMAKGRIGSALLEVVEQALAKPRSEQPQVPERKVLPNGLGPLIDLLKVLLKAKCEETNVAQKLIANTADLELIAAEDSADVAALNGWRYEIFGKDALRLKKGEIALASQGSKVNIVEL